MEIDSKPDVLDCIRKVYSYCESRQRKFTRDTYRVVSQKLKLPYTSDAAAKRVYGSWDSAVHEALSAFKEDPLEVASHFDSSYLQTIKKVLPSEDLYKVLVIPDIHTPFHNKKALDLSWRFAEAYEPDEIIQLGDVCDFYKISKYIKDPSRGVNIQAELDMARDLLREFKNRSGAKACTLLIGNHESRIRKYLHSIAPAMASLRSLTIEKLLDTESIGWRVIPEHNFYAINNVHFTHGEYVTKYSSDKHLGTYGETIIHGHTHRISCHMTKFLNRTIEGWEMGCLASLKVGQEYVKMANWQLRLGTVEISGQDYWITPHHIRDNRVTYNGRILSTE